MYLLQDCSKKKTALLSEQKNARVENKQTKKIMSSNSICCCVGRWQTRIKNLLNFAYEKKKKNYTDALSFQCQDHHGLK